MEKFSKLGIRKKTVSIMLAVYLVSLLILGAIFAYVYFYERKQQQEVRVNEAVQKTSERLDYFLKSTDNLTYNVMYSTWVQNVFDKGLSAYERRKRISNVRTVMNTLSFLNSDVQFVVYMMDGTRFNSNEWFLMNQEFELEKQDWFQTLQDDKKYIWSGEDQQLFYQNKEWCMITFYAIKNMNSLDLEAYVGVRSSLDTLEKNVFDVVERKECYMSLLDGDGSILYTEMPAELQNDTKELVSNMDEGIVRAKQNTVKKTKVKIGTKEYYLLCVLQNKSINIVNNLYWMAFLGIILLVAIILIVISAAISRYITNPVIRCKNAMIQIANNQIGITVENPYKDEFGGMLTSFNEMSVSIADLIKINQNISIMQKEAEYKLLERQINPHFLFNNLELINALILNEKPDNARKVCETLGELYHYNLQKTKYITLQEETEYTREYLYLMTYKVHNLTFYFTLDEKLKNMLVPKVIFQPLVENSIKHGFMDPNRDYCITLTAEQDKGDVLITIMDNGAGMSAGKLKALQESLDRILANAEQPLEEAAHVGLKNVTQRLAIEYGNRFTISIKAKEEYGVRIELRIREETRCTECV